MPFEEYQCLPIGLNGEMRSRVQRVPTVWGFIKDKNTYTAGPEGGECSHFSLGDIGVGDNGFLLSLGGRLQTVYAVLHLASFPMPMCHC